MSYKHLNITEREKILSLTERPVEAKERSRFGDWEVDTIVGKNRKSGLLTLVDRKSRLFFPKGYDFNALSDEGLQAIVDQLNKRLRKRLGYKTPWKIYFSTP